jgi:hypothetical protein
VAGCGVKCKPPGTEHTVDGSLDSFGPDVDLSVHSNISGEQECASAKNGWVSIKGS